MALEEGFDLAGFAPAGPARGREVFRSWLARGCHADMAWLARNAECRCDSSSWVPGTQVLLMTGLSYAVALPDRAIWEDPRRGRIARYAWGPDYHDEIGARLGRLAETIRREAGWADAPRFFVDTAPVLERESAASAGLGFVGRSSMLIHRQFGSLCWLGGIALPVALSGEEYASAPDPLRCAEGCARCVAACPPRALCEPYGVDARRCISYHTIENRGVIPAGIAENMRRWIFGCEECQTSCPWNARIPPAGKADFIAFQSERDAPLFETALEWNESDFRRLYRGTPVWRTRWGGFQRNLAAALFSSGHPEKNALMARIAARHPHPLARSQAQACLAQGV